MSGEFLLTPGAREKTAFVLDEFGRISKTPASFVSEKIIVGLTQGARNLQCFLVRLLPDVFVKHASGKGL